MTDDQKLPVDDAETELAVLDDSLRSLAVPTQAAELIADALNFLADNGAGDKGTVLDDIYDAAGSMLQTAQTLDQGFRASLNIAKTLRQQREETRQALDKLRNALQTADTSDDDIASLWEAIEEMVIESTTSDLYDLAWEYVTDNISDSSPLDWGEAERLVLVLSGGDLDNDHYLWDELRDWMRRAQETIDTGICPPPAPSFD